MNKAVSVNGTIYEKIHISNDKICGIRTSTSKNFEIPINKLYKAYYELKEFNTKTLKPYVDRVQSPSLAILRQVQTYQAFQKGN
ncbi:MAG: hypothetical protein K2K84_07210 [Muribaculaceae bacterium]|nr:hypothetical protein [Muribaculaceae bacterium]